MKKVLTIILLSILTLSGCKKTNPALDDYYKSMEAFINNMNSINNQMDNINISDEDSQSELLELLDWLDEEFLSMSTLKVPDEFYANISLSSEASAYMSEAVRLYHVYYEDEAAGIEFANAAKENYDRAMTRIALISTVLQGEIPEGDNITLDEMDGTDFDPVED